MTYKNAVHRMALKAGEMFRGETFGFYPIKADGSLAANPLQQIFNEHEIPYVRKDIDVNRNVTKKAKKKLITPVDILFDPKIKSVLIFDEPVVEGDTIMSGYAGIVAYKDVLGVDTIILASINDHSGVTDICCQPLYLTLHNEGKVDRKEFIYKKWPRIHRQIEESLYEIESNRIPINIEEILGLSDSQDDFSFLIGNLIRMVCKTGTGSIQNLLSLFKRSPYKSGLDKAAKYLQKLEKVSASL